MDFVVSQIPLYRTVLEYRTFVEEKICLTRGANTTQYIGLDVIVVTEG